MLRTGLIGDTSPPGEVAVRELWFPWANLIENQGYSYVCGSLRGTFYLAALQAKCPTFGMYDIHRHGRGHLTSVSNANSTTNYASFDGLGNVLTAVK